MQKIIGTKKQYYTQTNNAQVELFKDYFKRGNPIACGPTCFAMGIDIAGYDMKVFTPGEQPEDSILMIMHNPVNLGLFQKVRELDYDKYPPNEVPQLYPKVGEILYKKTVAEFSFGKSFESIKKSIDNENPVMMCGKFPAGGHYVLAVGYDDDRKVIIFNDPYPDQWEDKNGYNREMSLDFFMTLDSFKIEIFRNKNTFKDYLPIWLKR